MTTDPTPLQERIVQAMREEDGDAQHGPDAHPGYYEYAAAVLPIIAAEVRKAQADALREAAPLMHDHHDAAWLETQATEYETGDQA